LNVGEEEFPHLMSTSIWQWLVFCSLTLYEPAGSSSQEHPTILWLIVVFYWPKIYQTKENKIKKKGSNPTINHVS